MALFVITRPSSVMTHLIVLLTHYLKVDYKSTSVMCNLVVILNQERVLCRCWHIILSKTRTKACISLLCYRESRSDEIIGQEMKGNHVDYCCCCTNIIDQILDIILEPAECNWANYCGDKRNWVTIQLKYITFFSICRHFLKQSTRTLSFHQAACFIKLHLKLFQQFIIA